MESVLKGVRKKYAIKANYVLCARLCAHRTTSSYMQN